MNPWEIYLHRKDQPLLAKRRVYLESTFRCTGPMSRSTRRAILQRFILHLPKLLPYNDYFWNSKFRYFLENWFGPVRIRDSNLDCKGLYFHSSLSCSWCSAITICKEKVTEQAFEARIMFSLLTAGSVILSARKIRHVGRTNTAYVFCAADGRCSVELAVSSLTSRSVSRG